MSTFPTQPYGFQPYGGFPQQPAPAAQQPSSSSWDIGGDGGNSFGFERVGDQVTGQIVSLQEVQQTDIQSGEPKTFANGQPMMMYRVTLATQLRDPQNPADDGHRDVYLKGSRKSGCQSSLAAVLDAVRAATGSTQLQPRATLSLAYVGDGVPSQRGYTAPKLYAAQYLAPTMDLGQAATAVAQQQPAPQAYAPQQPAPQAYAPQQPAPQAYAPQQPAPQAPAATSGPTPEQVAALRNAGIDPATIYPGYTG